MRNKFFFYFFFTQYTQLFPSVHPFFSLAQTSFTKFSSTKKKKIEIKIYEWNELLYICKFARTLLFSCKISLFKNNEYYIQIKIIIFLSIRVLLEYLKKKKNHLKILACEKRKLIQTFVKLFQSHAFSPTISIFNFRFTYHLFHPFDEIHPPNYLFLWDKYIVKLLNYS